MNNEELKELYNHAYKDGNFFTFNDTEEMRAMTLLMPSWNGKHVLEIGCGEGRLTKTLALMGARATGIDYSSEAIKKASKGQPENTVFIEGDYRDLHHYKYDVVVMQGVLEHFDDPYKELKYILETNVVDNGVIITSSPGFMNPRGFVWMTFQLLLGVEMSLSDLHQIHPWEMEDFCDRNSCLIEMVSVDHDWAAGGRTITDFKKRFSSKSFQEKHEVKRENLDLFLQWLGHVMPDHKPTVVSGANIIYKIRRVGDA